MHKQGWCGCSTAKWFPPVIGVLLIGESQTSWLTGHGRPRKLACCDGAHPKALYRLLRAAVSATLDGRDCRVLGAPDHRGAQRYSEVRISCRALGVDCSLQTRPWVGKCRLILRISMPRMRQVRIIRTNRSKRNLTTGQSAQAARAGI